MLSPIGKKIKNILTEKNISQKELSKKTKIKQQIISDWINGRRNPKKENLNKIASALKIPPFYFLEVDENKNNFNQKNNVTTISNDIELLKHKIKILELKIELLEKK